MRVQNISAVTFAVRDMARAIDFYKTVGFTLVHGSEEDPFATLQGGDAYVNLALRPEYEERWWGRTIFRVDSADTLHAELVAQGVACDPPRDAAWGERYFHVRDPDGHELSFAEVVQQQS